MTAIFYLLRNASQQKAASPRLMPLGTTKGTGAGSIQGGRAFRSIAEDNQNPGGYLIDFY